MKRFKKVLTICTLMVTCCVTSTIAIAKPNTVTNDALNVEWKKNISDSKYSGGFCIEKTDDGGYIFSGCKNSYMYIAKTDKDGNKVWEKTFFENEFKKEAAASQIKKTNDGNYVILGDSEALGVNKSSFIIKINPNGDVIWSTQIEKKDLNVYLKSLEITDEGEYIAIGHIGKEDNNPDKSNYDVYICKLDSEGKLIKEVRYGGYENQYGKYIKKDKNGEFLVVGSNFASSSSILHKGSDIYAIKIDKNCNKLWEKNYSIGGSSTATCIDITKDGNFIISGDYQLFSHFVHDDKPVLLKIDGNGRKLWVKYYENDSKFNYIKSMDDGGIIAIGCVDVKNSQLPNRDFYLMKCNSNGEVEWSKKFGGDYKDNLYYIDEAYDNGYILTGFESVSTYDKTFVIIKMK